ncbi:MAG: hypothetical protein CWE10_20420 [Symbiobacterium thermophilum]|uniref:Uncharacterized protein n=3 Tax=Symbiobacterium thermophilum TaxID=2734 RepID=A0A953ICA2_SYMTR|nr:hypothetical protein [Symbiobacterium thermophilum]
MHDVVKRGRGSARVLRMGLTMLLIIGLVSGVPAHGSNLADVGAVEGNPVGQPDEESPSGPGGEDPDSVGQPDEEFPSGGGDEDSGFVGQPDEESPSDPGGEGSDPGDVDPGDDEDGPAFPVAPGTEDDGGTDPAQEGLFAALAWCCPGPRWSPTTAAPPP